jgi:hypothetical protein
MVPGALVVLERLPLTANGKVDRKALPEPEFVSQAYEAPQGEVEEALARIWADVLGVDRVGRGDNFFEFGGHSLLAVQMVARIQSLLQIDLAIRQIFTHPTVAGMASLIPDASHRTKTQSLLDIDAFIDSLEIA